jgi:hypothetical protein
LSYLNRAVIKSAAACPNSCVITRDASEILPQHLRHSRIEGGRNSDPEAVRIIAAPDGEATLSQAVVHRVRQVLEAFEERFVHPGA